MKSSSQPNGPSQSLLKPMENFSSVPPTGISWTPLQHRRPVFLAGACSPWRHLRKKMPERVKAASGGDTGHHHNRKGEMVDKSMMVLRRRIKELRSHEKSEDEPQSDHAACVYQAVGLLQLALMNARPAVGIAVAAMVALSVPTTVIFIILHLMEWGAR